MKRGSAFKGYTLNLLENIYRKKLDVAVNAEKMVDSLVRFGYVGGGNLEKKKRQK